MWAQRCTSTKVQILLQRKKNSLHHSAYATKWFHYPLFAGLIRQGLNVSCLVMQAKLYLLHGTVKLNRSTQSGIKTFKTYLKFAWYLI